MKILIVSDSLVRGGGAERFSVTLGNELANRGHKIHYLTFFDKNPKYFYVGEYSSLNVDDGNIFRKIKNFIFNPMKIKKICNEKEIDVLIGVGERANFPSIISKFFKNKSKIIVSQHLTPELYLNNKIAFNKIKFLYSKADKVICVSKSIEKTLKDIYKIYNTETIYNFVDVERCINLSNEKIPANYNEMLNSGYIFINIGRLDIQKGQWFLIRSFKKVANKYPDTKLVILGDGDLCNDLKNIIHNLNLENNVFLLGNQENIFPFLKRSDCFVLSSLFEGFPMTLIETLTMNLPVISTDCKTGPRECLCPEIGIDEKIDYPYYGGFGILSLPFGINAIYENKESLTKAEEMLGNLMLKMIEDPDLVTKYSNSFERIKSFDKEIIINEWERLFT
jgi:glycosyltransferase involved in cell wall biosynthesis